MSGGRTGPLTADQGQLFYAFHLDEVVPVDHLVRRIDAVLDLGWIHKALAFQLQMNKSNVTSRYTNRIPRAGTRQVSY